MDVNGLVEEMDEICRSTFREREPLLGVELFEMCPLKRVYSSDVSQPEMCPLKSVYSSDVSQLWKVRLLA